MTNASFNITINHDITFEHNKTLMLTMINSSLPYGVTVGDPGEATVTIMDDDSK